MVVAACTADGESEQAAANDVNSVIGLKDPVPEEAVVDCEETESGEIAHLRSGFGGSGCERGLDEIRRRNEAVSGELVFHKLVVGHVVVQRLNDPIAIAVGVREPVVTPACSVTFGIRVASHIEPMARPAHAVLRTGEEAGDEIFHRLLWVFPVLDGEGLNVSVSRLQAGKGKMYAATKIRGCGRGSEIQFSGLKFCCHEGVDRILRDGPNRRWCRILDREKGPMLSRIGSGVSGFGDLGFGRPGEAHGDPLLELLDLLGGEGIALFRHGFDSRRVLDRLDEFAARGIPGFDHGSVVAAANDGRPQIETETVFMTVHAVAVLATLGEHRPDFILEKFDLFTREVLRTGEADREDWGEGGEES